MNAKQKQEIIKMYAETIEAENDVKKRIRHIEKLKDTFSAEIENWEVLLREYADKKNLMGLISAMEVRSGHTPHMPSAPRPEKAEMSKEASQLPFYTSKSREQLDAEMKEFNEKRMRYVMLMSFADTLYKQGKLTLEGYYCIQEIFGEFYGFTEKSIFYWNGPHDGEPIKKDTHRRNKTYTRRDTAYWEEYEKKHKK